MNHLDTMLEQATKARDNAYAPYSKFKVGACIRTSSGQFFSGCNVENASYPLTQCAEGAAISNMVVNQETRIAEILIIGHTKGPISPCGACRQKIREFADEHTLVHMCSEKGLEKTLRLEELLPESFGPEFLL